jgi:hypothetical protein
MDSVDDKDQSNTRDCQPEVSDNEGDKDVQGNSPLDKEPTILV